MVRSKELRYQSEERGCMALISVWRNMCDEEGEVFSEDRSKNRRLFKAKRWFWVVESLSLGIHLIVIEYLRAV